MWSLARLNLAQSDPTWAQMDDDFAQWHLQHGLAAFPYLTQANGYFRRLEENRLDQVPPESRVRQLFDHEENRNRYQRAQRLQQKHSLSMGQVVLGYLISRPFPVFPLVGPKTLVDLEDSLMSVATKLSAADVFYLDHGRME